MIRSMAVLVLVALGGASAAEWSLSARPRLTLGSGASAVEEFDMVTSAVRLPDGRVAVADAGTRDVRLFNEAGRPVRTIGRAGEGPGEFRYPTWVGRWPGDSLAVWDATLQRLTIFAAAGTAERTIRLPGIGGIFPSFIGVFSDGSFAVTSGTDVAALRQQAGVVRSDQVYLRFGADGRFQDTLAVVPGSEAFVHRQGERMHWSPLPFGAHAFAAVLGERFYVADGGSGVVRALGPDGRAIRVLRVPPDERALTRADWRRLRDLRLQRLVRDDGSVGRLFADAPPPARYPAFDAFTVDAQGLIWIRRFTYPGEPARWEVYDDGGTMRAALRLPADLRITQIGSQHVLARGRGAYDVELVLLYDLARGR